MGRMLRSCLQSVLKLVNSVIGLAGMGMILYSLWMIRVWYKQSGGLVSTLPWFVYIFLGLGIFLCLITCSGHIAAETANGHCLSCYMVFVFLLVMLEAAITADIFLNRNWEEDFPEDPTGKFDELKDFVRSNFEMCKWIGLLVVAAQARWTLTSYPPLLRSKVLVGIMTVGLLWCYAWAFIDLGTAALSIFLAVALRALGPERGSYDDSDDDIVPARLPLLRNQVHHTSYSGEPNSSNNDSWKVRIHEKVSR